MTKEPITFDKLPQAVSYLTEQVEKIYQLVETLQPQKLDHQHQLIDIDKASILIQKSTLSKILCKWKQDSAVSLFLYLNSVFKNKHKLVHNQAPVMNRLCPFLLNLHK